MLSGILNRYEKIRQHYITVKALPYYYTLYYENDIIY